MNKEKIAIIGGSGFLGKRLQEVLSRNSYCAFENFDKDTSYENTTFIDVKNKSSLDVLKGFSTIINLAAEHKDNVRPISLYDQVNVKGALNICDISEKLGIKKIIFTSSVAVYGFAKPNTNEEGQINYFNDYGRTKYEAEKIYESWYRKDPDNRSLVVIRPTVIFGEGNRGNVYNLLNQVNSKRFFMIGKGKNIKSMAYVENVADFIKFSINLNQGFHLYNYVDKPDFNMADLIKFSRKTIFNKNNIGFRAPFFVIYFFAVIADMLSKLFKFNFPISRIRLKKFISTTQFDSNVYKTGFRPSISLEKALSKTISYEFLKSPINPKDPKKMKNKNL